MALTNAEKKEKNALRAKHYRGTITPQEARRLESLTARTTIGRPPKPRPAAPTAAAAGFEATSVAPPPEPEIKESKGPDDLPGVDMGPKPNAPPPPPPINPKRAVLVESAVGGIMAVFRHANAYVLTNGGLALPNDGPMADVVFSELTEAWRRIVEKWIPESAGTESLDEYMAFGSATVICGQAAWFSFKHKKPPSPAAQPYSNGASASPPPADPAPQYEGQKPPSAGTLGALVGVGESASA